ncbi:Sugar/inositol transporter [Pleurostoma richardsiae]|uniref:Sugar/inositol transporter n=1 Tax=Pleurostoma richardsiae TaxID=41990 RepID=A0AA38SFI2_9PEZI|nr:Sugar/inositol transporter [Pleurostoma richardsiae]
MTAGEPFLGPSPVTGYGSDASSQARTSWSAPLADDDPAVACVLSRAETFMGTLMAPGRDEIGAAQMVRYTTGQKFDLHHDWFQRPRLKDGDAGRQRVYNRVATFFVILEDKCMEGETYFPFIRPISPQDGGRGGSRVWREHKDGGLAFRPVAGNALFWVNLMANGTGDTRVLHAGLPVKDGYKTAMNIWPRMFFGPEA